MLNTEYTRTENEKEKNAVHGGTIDLTLWRIYLAKTDENSKIQGYNEIHVREDGHIG